MQAIATRSAVQAPVARASKTASTSSSMRGEFRELLSSLAALSLSFASFFSKPPTRNDEEETASGGFVSESELSPSRPIPLSRPLSRLFLRTQSTSQSGRRLTTSKSGSILFSEARNAGGADRKKL